MNEKNAMGSREVGSQVAPIQPQPGGAQGLKRAQDWRLRQQISWPDHKDRNYCLLRSLLGPPFWNLRLQPTERLQEGHEAVRTPSHASYGCRGLALPRCQLFWSPLAYKS